MAGPSPATGRSEQPVVPPPSTDVHVHLDTHPTHPGAVTASVTGPRHQLAHALHITPRDIAALPDL
ncbi:hypothetical protein [Streptomyces chattanoogensis]|uniref:Uncharacterized protein n=1 Tax=Streptomyces chattanoogensis TaxID=66876 RepID=A0A0N0XXU1_9ACTN|nr:hypothetical protein [Streptomyces chattanoogensis]KPC62675.1 hypothetical protein ADL29_18210 [Streptomyces chattanoogensis]